MYIPAINRMQVRIEKNTSQSHQRENADDISYDMNDILLTAISTPHP